MLDLSKSKVEYGASFQISIISKLQSLYMIRSMILIQTFCSFLTLILQKYHMQNISNMSAF